jgi:lipid-binding SYLF domain-containing protein
MKNVLLSILAVALVGAMSFSANAATADKQNSIARDAQEVLQQMMAMPEQAIPPALLDQAEGIVVLPGMLRAGFVIGGRYGNGVLLVRDEQRRWSSPVFVSMIGGSLGWQIGASATDVVLVFKTRKGIENIFNGKITLGADASVAAGPVGRQLEGATDITFKSEIYSYSRSRGLFAGIQVEGASLSVDHTANSLFYGHEGVTPQQVVSGDVRRQPASADALRTTVSEVTDGGRSG